MANSNRRPQGKTQRLQPKPVPVVPILSTPAGKWAPNWDDPNVRMQKNDRETKPGRINPGEGSTRSVK